MSDRPYNNNLVKNDRVKVVSLGRQGKVRSSPRSPATQRKVAVCLDGSNTPRYFDVMDLRLQIGPGEFEDVPPIDGSPPPEEGVIMIPRDKAPAAVQVLKAERDDNQAEMDGMTARHKFLRESNDKLDRAIAVLEGRSQ